MFTIAASSSLPFWYIHDIYYVDIIVAHILQVDCDGRVSSKVRFVASVRIYDVDSVFDFYRTFVYLVALVNVFTLTFLVSSVSISSAAGDFASFPTMFAFIKYCNIAYIALDSLKLVASLCSIISCRRISPSKVLNSVWNVI
jgi:hypothetical protein